MVSEGQRSQSTYLSGQLTYAQFAEYDEGTWDGTSDHSVSIGLGWNPDGIHLIVVVEDDVFIGAGTLVPPNKRLESGFLYVGNPMQKKRPLNDAEMAFLKQSAVNYVVLKDEYLEEAN